MSLPQAPRVWTVRTKVWTAGLKCHTYPYGYKPWTDTPNKDSAPMHFHRAVRTEPAVHAALILALTRAQGPREATVRLRFPSRPSLDRANS